jgi:hypothetical protein
MPYFEETIVRFDGTDRFFIKGRCLVFKRFLTTSSKLKTTTVKEKQTTQKNATLSHLRYSTPIIFPTSRS